jgi:hypothetical protein
VQSKGNNNVLMCSTILMKSVNHKKDTIDAVVAQINVNESKPVTIRSRRSKNTSKTTTTTTTTTTTASPTTVASSLQSSAATPAMSGLMSSGGAAALFGSLNVPHDDDDDSASEDGGTAKLSAICKSLYRVLLSLSLFLIVVVL